LDSIFPASEHIRNQHRIGVLTVASPAAFAIWWLVPRLGRFAALHPEIEVRIATIDGREPDLLRDGIDVAVVKRPAKAPARNPLEMPLLSEVVFPVCSPSLLSGASSLGSPSDLTKHSLIECDAAAAEDTEFGWSIWLPRLGLSGAPTGDCGSVNLARRCRQRLMDLVSRSVGPRWLMLNSLLAGLSGPSRSGWLQRRRTCLL
jgi:DNA-binding transcriptional LysR family regulator